MIERVTQARVAATSGTGASRVRVSVQLAHEFVAVLVAEVERDVTPFRL